MKFKELFTRHMEPNWGFIETIGEFAKMKDTPQSNIWHKEGNVFEHTRLVTTEMAMALDLECVDKKSERYLVMMSAAICHDLGKISTTKYNEEIKDYTCNYHGYVGGRIARLLFYDEDIELREKVCYMVTNHMKPFYAIKDGKTLHNIITLSMGRVNLYDLLLLNRCDGLGCINDEPRLVNEERIETIMHYAKIMKCLYEPYKFDNRAQRYNFMYNDSNGVNKLGKFDVYFMVGLPGAGKDTWISNNIPNLKSICLDEIRKELGLGDKVIGTKEQENTAINILKDRVIKCCDNKESFVINKTNLKRVYRDELHRLLLPYMPYITYVYVEAPTIDDNIKRRENMIKPSAIKEMYDSFDFPDVYEYDKIILEKQRNE